MSKDVIDEVRDDCQILNDSHTALDKNNQFPKEHRKISRKIVVMVNGYLFTLIELVPYGWLFFQDSSAKNIL